MEFWLILSKLSLMFFIGYSAVLEVQQMGWVVLLLLLYFILNIAILLYKKKGWRLFLLTVSILAATAGYRLINPLFLILLPLSIQEWLSEWAVPKWVLFTLPLLPVFIADQEIAPVYILTACLSFVICTCASIFTTALEKKERQLDQMRASIGKLTRSLNENQEFIRQSEYTYKLEERNRISQEIHDNIGHAMTGALIQMEAAKRLMESNPNQAKQLLQNAISISQDGIESIRLTLKRMKPPIEQVGIHRLRLSLDEFSARYDVEAALTYKGNLEMITPIQWKVIHENIKETLTNMRKYAGASRVTLDIQILNKVIRVEVKDNGKGAEKIKKGLGIIGMEERTASLHGHIIVDGTNGFSVTMLLPIGQ